MVLRAAKSKVLRKFRTVFVASSPSGFFLASSKSEDKNTLLLTSCENKLYLIDVVDRWRFG